MKCVISDFIFEFIINFFLYCTVNFDSRRYQQDFLFHQKLISFSILSTSNWHSTAKRKMLCNVSQMEIRFDSIFDRIRKIFCLRLWLPQSLTVCLCVCSSFTAYVWVTMGRIFMKCWKGKILLKFHENRFNDDVLKGHSSAAKGNDNHVVSRL